jgi:hypothetical protein
MKDMAVTIMNHLAVWCCTICIFVEIFLIAEPDGQSDSRAQSFSEHGPGIGAIRRWQIQHKGLVERPQSS